VAKGLGIMRRHFPKRLTEVRYTLIIAFGVAFLFLSNIPTLGIIVSMLVGATAVYCRPLQNLLFAIGRNVRKAHE
jgi:membrane protein YqaA with SNARE-associated domain